MFEKASRMKLRFEYKGQCSTEDLWDLSLSALDLIFKKLNAAGRMLKEESLLESKSTEETALDLRIAIVRHIVQVKLQEKKAREESVLKAERKQKILGIIAEKQDESLRNMPEEELFKLVNEL